MDLLLYQHFTDLAEESEFNCSKTEDVYTCQFECYGGPNIKPTVLCSGESVLYHKEGTNIWNITFSSTKAVAEIACTFSFNNEGGGRVMTNFPGEFFINCFLKVFESS